MGRSHWLDARAKLYSGYLHLLAIPRPHSLWPSLRAFPFRVATPAETHPRVSDTLHLRHGTIYGAWSGSPTTLGDLDPRYLLGFEIDKFAKQVEACFGLVFTGGDESASPYDVASANTSSTTSDGRQLVELEPGMIHYAAKGEEVKTIDPQRPGATFAPFVEQTLRSIAAPVQRFVRPNLASVDNGSCRQSRIATTSTMSSDTR